MAHHVISGLRSDKTPTPLRVATDGSLVPAGQLAVPAYDYMALTYYGATNNIQTQVFKSGGASGTTVATITYTYVNSAVADDDRIASITLS